MTIGLRSLMMLVCLSVLAFPVSAKVVKFDRGDKTVYDFQIDDVSAKIVEAEGEQYFRASFVGVDGYEGILYKKGHAEIPVVRFYVETLNPNDIQVIFVKGGEIRASLDKAIYPAQESLEKIAGSKIEFVKDDAFYKSKNYWPAKSYTVEKVGTINGKIKSLISVYPLQYLPAKNSYRLRSNFTVEVKKAPLLMRAKNEQKELFVMVVAQQFKNSEYIAQYAAFKRKLGFEVEILVVGDDVITDDDIRASLQARLPLGLKYAMLVGEHDEVPSHTATHISGVTDHYYRAIDTNDYQDDINGPDIGVGRITPKNEVELQNTIEKFIRYQVGKFSHEEWLTHPSFIGTDDKYLVAEGSHNYVIETYLEGLGYTGSFPEANMPGADRLYAITHNVSDEKVLETMREGRFLINYSGHGSTTTWAGPRVNQDDVRSFDDNEILPFVISNACITSKFTINESFGETWIKHPAGAIMFWGSMDSSYWDEDDIMEKRFYDGIYRDGLRTFSSMTQNALLELWRHYGGEGRVKYYWETYVILGDPSIELRTWKTEVPNFEGPDVLPIGVPTLTYILTNSEGRPYINTKVSLSIADGETLSSAVTNEFGEVSLLVDGAMVGQTLEVVAFGSNIRMEAIDVLVVSPDSPYLVASKYVVNGEEKIFLSPFQEIALSFEIENVSDVATGGATIEIISIEGNAEVLNQVTSVPALEGHAIFNVEGENLRFKVGNASNGAKIEILFRWTTTEGDTAEFKKSFIVARAGLVLTQVDFGNAQDPMTGGMGPGESGDIYITVTNSGLAPMTGAILEFQPGSCMTDISGQIEIANLAAGETLRIETPITVIADTNCENADLASFSVLGEYQDVVENLSLSSHGSFSIGRIGRAVSEQDNLEMAIEDNSTTTYAFEVPGIEKIKDVTVHVRLRHTYQGDIQLRLLHPSGKIIVLRDRTGGGTDDIDEVYHVATLIPVEELMALNSEGEWKLEVVDKANNDQGTLDYVKVDVIGYVR